MDVMKTEKAKPKLTGLCFVWEWNILASVLQITHHPYQLDSYSRLKLLSAWHRFNLQHQYYENDMWSKTLMPEEVGSKPTATWVEWESSREDI